MARGITRARDALFTSSGDQFAAVVATLLDGLLERSAQSKRLGDLDCSGIDGYAYRAEGDALETVIQCKGFEAFEYGQKQQMQCCDELKKYLSKGPFTPNYWLVVNKSIVNREMRGELENHLASLVIAKKVNNAELLDLDKFLAKLKELASNRLASWAESRRAELFKFYAERMVFVDYIREVPFKTKVQLNDPVNYIYDRVTRFFDEIPKNQTGKYRPAPKYLVTSGFGFGKTSTLHELAREWIRSGKHLIYVPAPLLDDRAFAHATGLADALLSFVLPDDHELNDLVRDLIRDALKYSFSNSRNWLLLIDGLDESPWALKPGSLARLWRCIRDLGLAAALSAREELVNSRPTEFSDGVLQIPFDRLELLDWPDELILHFLDRFASCRDGTVPDGFREFRELVRIGQYANVYGDIPKRPLFLGMLAVDAWAGCEPVRQLHRLYGQYFRRKFSSDRFSSSALGESLRPSRIVEEFGNDEACERLILIMEDAASRMVGYENRKAIKASSNAIILHDTINEDDLKLIAANHGIAFLQFEDLTMHSLLQPSGRDSVTRARLSRFAHRSYQDWFLARHLARIDCDGATAVSEAVARFLIPMVADREQGLGLP
jgi:hypothetical protein